MKACDPPLPEKIGTIFEDAWKRFSRKKMWTAIGTAGPSSRELATICLAVCLKEIRDFARLGNESENWFITASRPHNTTKWIPTWSSISVRKE